MLASTSPPIRQFGPMVVPPRTFARKSWVSRPMKQGPSTLVNGWTQAPAAIVIGPLVVSKTVYGSTLADSWIASRSEGPTIAALARCRLVSPLTPSASKSQGQVVGVAGDEVPGAGDPLAADLAALDPARQVLEPGVDPAGPQARGVVGADPGAGGLAVAEADPGAPSQSSAPSKPARGDPSAVGDEHRALGRASRRR